MIRVRQVKIEVISYSLEKLYNATLKKLKLPKVKILDLKIVQSLQLHFLITVLYER